MALALTLKPGQEAVIGTRRMKVIRVNGFAKFTVSFEGKEYDLTQDSWVQLAEGIHVRASVPKSSDRLRVRVQINAPLYIVLRDSLLTETEKE